MTTGSRIPDRRVNLNPDRYRLFAEAFTGAAKGNSTLAAEMAGYADADAAGYRLLKRPDVQKMIVELRAPLEARGVMDREELLTWLSTVIRDVADEHTMKDRLSAAALFAKCTGNVIDRVQLEAIQREERSRSRELAGNVIEVEVATRALRLIRAGENEEEMHGDE